ncbi:GIY-YIG nuclease family protein [Nocardiopsis synnemataformans]|uniref:GIY-YIG nuclease family protein n=1 Tax=Nocardiopsis synnemataformans TaxID=61305 RepID=UPI003EBF56E2
MSKTALYRFFDKDGQLLYVGITERLGQRWLNHAQKKPWWDDVHIQTAEWFPERALAAEAEKLAIRSEHPKYNSSHSRRWERPKPPEVTLSAEAESDQPESKIPGFFTVEEVAVRMKVKITTVHRELHRKRLPEPDARVVRSPVWKVETILAWEKDRASASWNRRK